MYCTIGALILLAAPVVLRGGRGEATSSVGPGVILFRKRMR